jgi:protein O-mannosyl-transferase
VAMRLLNRKNLLRLGVLVITLLVFSRLIKCDFTWWDDNGTIHHNPQLNSPGFYWTAVGAKAPMQLYIPLTFTFWSGISRLAELPHPDVDGIMLNAHVFHAANVMLHGITAVLVFELLVNLIRNPLAAAAGAMLFALHPVQVEPVGWISGTKDVLYGLFSVAALLEYVRFALKGGKWHYLAGILLFVMAMLSKPTAIVVPLMAATIDLFLLKRSRRNVLFSLLPWFCLMIPCAISTMLAQPTTLLTPLPGWMSPAIAADAVAFYLYKLAIPIRMCVDYGRRPPVVLSHGWIYYTWLLPIVVFAILFSTRRRWPIGVTAALLFVLPLAPVLGLKPFMFQEISTTADHYLYLAMLGPALLAAWIIDGYPNRIVGGIAIIALVILTVLTVRLEPVWQNTRTLFEHAMRVNPDSFEACDMLGYIHERNADLHRNDPQRYRTELVKSAGYYLSGIDLNPEYVPSLFNVAIVFQKLGQDENARRAIRRIADLQANIPVPVRTEPIVMAEKLIAFGDYSEAIRWLDQILLVDPGNTRAMKLRVVAVRGYEKFESPAATRPDGG